MYHFYYCYIIVIVKVMRVQWVISSAVTMGSGYSTNLVEQVQYIKSHNIIKTTQGQVFSHQRLIYRLNYSGTCLERPLKGPRIGSLCRQVVFIQRCFIVVELASWVVQ